MWNGHNVDERTWNRRWTFWRSKRSWEGCRYFGINPLTFTARCRVGYLFVWKGFWFQRPHQRTLEPGNGRWAPRWIPLLSTSDTQLWCPHLPLVDELRDWGGGGNLHLNGTFWVQNAKVKRCPRKVGAGLDTGRNNGSQTRLSWILYNRCRRYAPGINENEPIKKNEL